MSINFTRRIARLQTLFVCLIALLAFFGPVAQASAAGDNTALLSPEELQLFNLVNAERAKAHCQPLVVNLNLEIKARNNASSMASRGTIQSTYMKPEFLAMGSRMTPDYLISVAWNDAERRATMLNCTYKYVGIGYAFNQSTTFQRYWTMLYAAKI